MVRDIEVLVGAIKKCDRDARIVKTGADLIIEVKIAGSLLLFNHRGSSSQPVKHFKAGPPMMIGAIPGARLVPGVIGGAIPVQQFKPLPVRPIHHPVLNV